MTMDRRLIVSVSGIRGIFGEGLIIPPKLYEPRRRGCCGKPIEDYEVRIVDDDDLPLGPCQTGELVFRPRAPYTMMTGYYKMPEATLEAFRNLWFHTGDLGYFDEDGFLYYVGRKKDAIRRRGENRKRNRRRRGRWSGSDQIGLRSFSDG